VYPVTTGQAEPDERYVRPTRPARRRRTRPTEPVPASGAWREDHPIGNRQFVDLGPLQLEAGGQLPQVTMSYESWGHLNEAGDNAILVLHALTGGSHVTGDQEPGHPSAGWWAEMVGPGRPLDTDRYFVVAPNVLGGCQGSTGPSSDAPNGTPWGSRFPYVTVRDQVAAEIELADHLGVSTWQLVIGASMGGHRVLEWAVTAPERVAAIAPIATSAATSADQIAWAHAQLGAIRADPKFRGGDYYDAAPGDGPHVGLGIARQIAHTTYRSSYELDERFGRIPQGGENPLGGGGRFAVQSYLDHHADKLSRRFDANSYVALTQSMLTHDLGRDRGGTDEALASIRARTLALAVDSDRLFPPSQSRRIADGVQNGTYRELRSDHGHDGFLVENEQVAQILAEFLQG